MEKKFGMIHYTRNITRLEPVFRHPLIGRNREEKETKCIQ